MALTYIVCFLVVLQVVSSNHIPITTSPTVEETTWEFATDSNDTITDFSVSPSEGAADSTDDTSTVAEEAPATTLGPSNATLMTTTDDNSTFVVVTNYYVTVTDDPSTTVEPETTLKPKPIENMAAVVSQTGMMFLLPLLVRFVWPHLWWSR